MPRTLDGSAIARRFILLALALVAPAASSGCAVVKATRQPDKKDLGILNPGVPRTHVIAELGAPVWTEERGGITTDIFSFKQGYSKPVKAGRAFAHGAADVVTFGLWEVVGVPVETLADGTQVQLEVRYDPNRLVESVTVIRGHEVVAPESQVAERPPPDPRSAELGRRAGPF